MQGKRKPGSAQLEPRPVSRRRRRGRRRGRTGGEKADRAGRLAVKAGGGRREAVRRVVRRRWGGRLGEGKAFAFVGMTIRHKLGRHQRAQARHEIHVMSEVEFGSRPPREK